MGHFSMVLLIGAGFMLLGRRQVTMASRLVGRGVGE